MGNPKQKASMKQSPLLLMSCLFVAVAIAGCVAPTASSRTGNSSLISGVTGSSALPSVVEGTITSPIAVEEGFLRLDLSDGTRMELMTDESVAPMDYLLRASGKRCRVFYKDGFYEDVDGSRSPALQMTRIEWL